MSEYYLPIGLLILAFIIVPLVIKIVGATVKAVLVGIAITALLGTGAFASFKAALDERVDAEVGKRAAASDTWKKVQTSKAETAKLRKKLKNGEAKVYKVAGVNQKCARKLAASSTPGSKAASYLLYCEDGNTYRVTK